MTRTSWNFAKGRFASAALAAVVAAAGAASITAQSQPRGNAPPPRRTAPAAAPRGNQAQSRTQPPAPAGGLDTLTDDALYSELAGRGQESLLDRAFELNKVPEAQRAGLRAFGALRELSNKAKPPTAARRQALIQQVVAGAQTVLPTMKDPAKLSETAYLLLTEGASNLIEVLEYWGDNPNTQARLRPVMETVLAMYDRAADEYDAAKADVERRMSNPNDKVSADRWAKLEADANTARYDRHMADYYLAIALPKSGAGAAERAKIADAGIEYLKELDADDSDLQPALRPQVRNRIGKLLLAKGDFAGAKETFQTVVTGKGFKQPPDVSEQYDARYFSVAADLQSGNAAAARTGLSELLKWQQQNLPNKPQVQKNAATLADLMQYRIYGAEAAAARAAGKQADADKAQAAAVDVLTKLSNERPELRAMISEQLVDRIDARRPVNTLDPMLLRALMQKGIAERDKGEGEQPDPQVLARAIEAAQELARRKGSKGVDEQVAEYAALVVPTFLERLGRKTEAANRYLDFLKAYPRSGNAEAVFNSAFNLIVLDLRRGPDRGGKEVVDVWTRFLPIAIEKPYNQLGLAFDYAQRLRSEGKLKEAAAYYARVPEKDPRYASARYLQMVSLYSLLLQTSGDGGKAQYVVQGDDRARLAAEVLRLAGEAKKLASDAAASARDDAERARQRVNVAGTTLTMAEVAYLANDPARTLKVLEGFEGEVKDLPGAQAQLDRALFLRVNSLIRAGQLEQATRQLLDLLEKSGGKEGQDIVFNLLSRLNEEFDKAEAAGDQDAMRRLAQSRASLSGSLVQWAKTNKNPDINKRVFSYSLYDADSKRLAGTLAGDQKLLREALAAYQKLQSPEMDALFKREAADNPKLDPNSPHPNVLLGIGLTSFDLGDYKTAQATLGPLLVRKRLGGPEQPKLDEKTGETRYEDNEPYWEANYKLLRSNVELYKQNKNDPAAAEAYENTKSGLKSLYVRGNVGGQKWKQKFEDLRREIIPDFDPKTLAPQSRPATEPAPTPPAG